MYNVFTSYTPFHVKELPGIPLGPVEPSNPTPVAPVAPVLPVAPVAPVLPVAPVEPDVPVEPIKVGAVTKNLDIMVVAQFALGGVTISYKIGYPVEFNSKI